MIEAGLGGRYDATSVIDSRLTVLTNVGLEHTRWLGPTVQGHRRGEARGAAAGHDARARRRTWRPRRSRWPERVADRARMSADRLTAGCRAPRRRPTISLAARGAFQRRNFALARTAAETYLRSVGIEPREDAVREAAADDRGARAPAGGRRGAADGARRRAQPRCRAGARRVAARAARRSSPGAGARRARGQGRREHARERCWRYASARGSPPLRAAARCSPAALQSLARQLGFDAVVCEPEPWRALAEARRWARERGDGAAVLATGSVYLVGDLLGHLADVR